MTHVTSLPRNGEGDTSGGGGCEKRWGGKKRAKECGESFEMGCGVGGDGTQGRMKRGGRERSRKRGGVEEDHEERFWRGCGSRGLIAEAFLVP